MSGGVSGAAVRTVLRRLEAGRLEVVDRGRRIVFGPPAADLRATVTVNDPAAWRGPLHGSLGLGEAYVDGAWDTDDLVALIRIAARELRELDGLRGAVARPRGLLHRVAHAVPASTRSRARENISAHYDLGNRFYERWLDDSMLYSSAMYDELHEGKGAVTDDADFRVDVGSLEQAQARRLDRIVELLDLRAGQRVLEIGCGWGTLAATLAKRCGVQVVGLTLSTEQLRFAQARAQQWGVADQVDLRLQDYRDVEGRFDRIVSIEMIEAVGEAYWPVYFSTLRDRLKPDGLAVLQAITIDEQHFERYRANPDFIQRCIFPGGMLPTPERMAEEARKAGLGFSTQARFGRGYAATLVEWRRRFLAEWPAIEAQGFDLPFKRLWEYYLCYCEAGFRSGRVDVGLYRLTHAS